MKPKPNPLQHVKAVGYQWTSAGVVHHGHTVLMASSRAGLKRELKKFFTTNLHIQPDQEPA